MASRRRSAVRIIAGRWRHRRLPVPASPGLRPTPDRVRETLFNWLAPDIEGARCVDLFAGTGALGLEAASRGAARVVLVERDAAIARHLREQANALDTGDVTQVVHADAFDWLVACTDRFDVVFLDPPFGGVDVPDLLARLADRAILAPGARVYVESAAGDASAQPPPDWRIVRERRAGRVRYYLASPPAAKSPSSRAPHDAPSR